MDNILDDITAKLTSAGMDQASVSASRKALSAEFSRLTEEELEKKLAAEGGADGITDSILKKYEEAKKRKAEGEPDLISLDDAMFSDEPDNASADSGNAAAETSFVDNSAESVISQIEENTDTPSKDADDYFNDDADVIVKQPEKKKKSQKLPIDTPVRSHDEKGAPKKKNPSIKNMSQRAKTAYIIGLVLLIPLLIALIVMITVVFLALYAVVAAMVVAFAAALVVIAAVGTALSLMAIIFGIIQLVQGAAAPIGIYEIGLGVVAGGITLGLSILLYNFIVRLAPFLFIKIFALYKFLFKQLTKLLGLVKGACSKL